ncbi:1-acyl-sn-glycerol-3-phosphate acyltransferase [Roseibium salinum]|nr:1-acyl-sn-glycerol-3-phosphate acyltransferase [Roseibium salinum]
MQRKLPQIWHRVATRLVGIRVRQDGQPSHERPLLIVSNHASWVDITILGSLMPLSFIAKSEVSRWPVFRPVCEIAAHGLREPHQTGAYGPGG